MASPRSLPETPLPEPLEGLDLVPEGGFFEGQIALVSDTRIDGHVAGTLRGTGKLALGPGARVDGPVECDELTVAGAVRGTIAARHRVRLEPGARVDGDIETPVLEVADEATWNGAARIGTPARAEPPEESERL